MSEQDQENEGAPQHAAVRLRQFHEVVRQQYVAYADEAARRQLVSDARQQVRVAHGVQQPFAFSTQKGEIIYSVRPTFADALNAARELFSSPTAMITILAWFPDGSSYTLRWEFLCRFNAEMSPHEWIDADQAAELAASLFELQANT